MIADVPELQTVLRESAARKNNNCDHLTRPASPFSLMGIKLTRRGEAETSGTRTIWCRRY
jgi:hypothetical protein